jgi:hypothetical protein
MIEIIINALWVFVLAMLGLPTLTFFCVYAYFSAKFAAHVYWSRRVR